MKQKIHNSNSTHFCKKLTHFFGIVVLFFLSLSIQAQTIDMDKLKGMKPRSIGPAGMSGRITSIDAVIQQPEIIYAGTASGGLWKSENGGTSWKPIFEKEKAASVGAIAIQQSNPEVLWVGTGEGNPRNSVSSGYGVFKSLDRGKSWQHLGLEKTKNIHRIIIHPNNPNIVYVAAIGSPWGPHEERGVYKTTDGGKTWKKVLYINSKTGAADMVIDPGNPNKLIAAMWEHQRQPWFFQSGGKGSGIYITYDGGATWKKSTEKDGLPKGDLGRVGLTIAPSNPNRVYALIEADKNGFYSSHDGGATWKKVTDTGNFGNRPFYYSDIFADPINENKVYSLYSYVSVTNDGGKNWDILLPWSEKPTDVHVDHHAWWMSPKNPKLIYNGNDGGFNISRDGGKTWKFVENLPVAQFYHIRVDQEMPYHVLGGMQDNGSWRGPAYTWKTGGIRNGYWQEVLFGDGFDVMSDPDDARYVYAMWQEGNVNRIDVKTGAAKAIQPVHPDSITLRFNWNAAMAQDPFDNATIYYGSQFLHKSSNKGTSWNIISPDLTTNDTTRQKQVESGGLTVDATGAENYTSITAIAPSPVKEGVIWVGTDDGNLQLTQDGGKTWENLIGKLKEVPKNSWIPQIHVSTHQAGEAFVVINNYRRNDWTPYVYHTTNFGKSWKKLAKKEQVWGYALSIVQDPVEPKLLFLGTEFGLYVSIDGGENWTKWTNGYPTVSTMDMAIHPREHDLVIGTFGRAAFVLDDIRPLREIAQEGTKILKDSLHIFPAPNAVLAQYITAAGTRFAANGEFLGQNRPGGAMLTFSVKKEIKEEEEKTATEKSKDKPKEKKEGKVMVEILSGQEVIRTFKVEPKENGINRIQWDLRRKGVRYPSRKLPKKDAKEPAGIAVLPGTYTVRMTYGTHKDSTTVKVITDPRIKVSEVALKEKQALQLQLMQHIEMAYQATKNLNEANKTLSILTKNMEEDNTLLKKTKAMQDSVKTLLNVVLPEQGKQGYFNHDNLVSSKLNKAMYYLNSSRDAPTPAGKLLVQKAEKDLKTIVQKINKFLDKDWKTFRKEVEDTKFSIFKELSPLEVD